MIEEAYEAVDAIEKRDLKHLREELGDVLLQVVLQSQIAADAGEFDVADVCQDAKDDSPSSSCLRLGACFLGK